MVKNEKIIKNISKTTGVTPEQLYKHCRTIVFTIPNTKYLDDDHINFAINDCVVGVYKKMCSGELDKFNYTAFRGYLFMALRNNISAQNLKMKRSRDMAALKEELSESDAVSFPFPDEIDYHQQLAALIKKMDKDEQDFLNFYITNKFKFIKQAYANYTGNPVNFKNLVYRLKAEKRIKITPVRKDSDNSISGLLVSNYPRENFYSQNQVTKKFKITTYQLKEILKKYNIPTFKRVINSNVIDKPAIFMEKKDIDDLNIPLRKHRK